MPGRRIHFDSGRADPEIRIAAGPSDVRLNSDRVLHAGRMRRRKFLEPSRDPRQRRPIDARAGAVAVLVAVLAFVPGADGRRSRLAAAGEDADHRAGHRSGRVSDGHALPQRLAAFGRPPRAVGALGLVTQCGGQRAGVGRSDCAGDIHRPAVDVFSRRGVVFVRDAGDSGDTRSRKSSSGLSMLRVRWASL